MSKATAMTFDFNEPRFDVADLEAFGYAVTEPLFDVPTCRSLARAYEQDALFRKTVVMENHAYGQGRYRYFANPLPVDLAAMRAAFYKALRPVAVDWHQRLRMDGDFPESYDDFLARCAAAGQERPTPLLLQYNETDFNRLHQDIYGDVFFPLQVAILLSEPGRDFEGGDFVLTEQRVRMQSQAEVVPLKMGCGVIFAGNYRPVQGKRGWVRTAMRHGVSRLRSGRRYCLGVILHNART